MTENAKKKSENFSVALGLTDYINPVFYTISSLLILKNMKEMMSAMDWRICLIGVIVSLIGGYIIPTGKLIVGLGLIRFVMPVPLVLFVNSGILITGLILLKTVFSISAAVTAMTAAAVIAFLIMVVKKTKKLNTAAVLTGALGYLMIYAALICLSLSRYLALPVIMYALAIMLFIALIITGIKADLYDARVHWFIEIANIICQGSVALGTFLLFHLL